VSEATETNKTEEREGLGEFYRQARSELDKASFPSSDDVSKTVAIVILNVIFFAVFLFLIDHGWTYAIDAFKWAVTKIAG